MHPRRWVRVRRVAGTDAKAIAAFCEKMCGLIEGPQYIAGTDEYQMILWDNLRVHMTLMVYRTIEARDGPYRFLILPRLAYQPKYGPIEYKICDLLLYMQCIIDGEMNLDQMEHAIISSAA